MGGICLRQQPVLGEIDEDNSIWRIVSKSGTRTIDPMLPLIKDVSHIELFDLLQEPVAQTALGNYANTIERDHVLMCWAEIQQFKGEAAPTLRSLQAVEIYENYVKAGSPMRLREVSEILDDTYRKLLEPQLSRADRQRVQSDGNDGDVFHASFFAELQSICFEEIYEAIYKGFVTSEEFKTIRGEMNSRYNMVKTTDFDYFETLGKGSFGIVMRCRKKSTKQFYAMKIIAKTELLHACRHDLHSVDVEVRALASLRHPFIIGMDYSFQNSQYAFIVMELAEGGTLASVLKCFRKQVLTEPHIRFYVAEIAEALHYLHGLGILYQDLKLANVLIHTDGHVKLADLGGVVDLGGDVISTNKNSEGQITSQSPLAAWAEPSLAATFKSSHLSNPRRNHSVYGTRGYMAPEVLELLVPNRVNCRGSAYMADWWSLGIVAYILLTGERPFNVPKHCSAEEELLHIRAGHLSFPESTSPGCVEFICSLLEEDDTKRLGFGVDGFNDIMNHPFFESFKWSKVITKMCRPPYVPSEMDVLYDPDQVEKPLYDGFDSLPMFDQDARAPSTKDKNLFKDWNYISPTTLRIEFGMANAQKQYQQNLKVQRLLGEKASSTETTMRAMLSSWTSTTSTTNKYVQPDTSETAVRMMFSSGNNTARSNYSSGSSSPTKHNFPRRTSAAVIHYNNADPAS